MLGARASFRLIRGSGASTVKGHPLHVAHGSCGGGHLAGAEVSRCGGVGDVLGGDGGGEAAGHGMLVGPASWARPSTSPAACVAPLVDSSTFP